MQRTLSRFCLLFLSLGMLFSLPVRAADFAPEPADWSILVYLNGDNDLDPYGSKDMEEMRKVGSDSHVNVIVLRDTSDQTVSSKIYRIEKGGMTVAKDFGTNVDMGDWRNLVAFFEFARENFPAKHYLVDVWNHGSGWMKRRKEQIRGISYDDGSGNHITTPQLGQALAEIRKLNDGRSIDVFGMDACLMQMAEVLYEIGTGADVVVGSEEVEPADGWSYDQFLGKLVARPEMSPTELATEIVETYRNYYEAKPGNDVQASAIDTAAFLYAQENWNAFVRETLPWLALYHDDVISSFYNAQKFYVETYVDMIGLISALKDLVKNPALSARADAAIADLSRSVIVNSVLGETLAGSHGISIWAPDAFAYSGSRTSYGELKWARESSWKTLLEALANPTTPLVHLERMNVRGLNPSGFVNPGSDIEIAVHLENGSKIPATGIGLGLELPEGFTLKSGPGAVDLTPATGMKAQGKFVIHAESRIAHGTYPLALTISVPGVGQSSKPFDVVIERVYKLEKKKISTPHPYKAGTNKEWTITKAGASSIRVHFKKFLTEKDIDNVYLYDGSDNLVRVLTGDLGAFWSEEVPGETVKVLFVSDETEHLYGFDIDQFAY